MIAWHGSKLLSNLRVTVTKVRPATDGIVGRSRRSQSGNVTSVAPSPERFDRQMQEASVRPHADWNCFNEPAELQSIACGAGRADRELVYEIVGAGSDCAPLCSDGSAEGAASLSILGW